jgi:hypothetical protein
LINGRLSETPTQELRKFSPSSKGHPKNANIAAISFPMVCHFLEPAQHEITLDALHLVRLVLAQHGPGPHH